MKDLVNEKKLAAKEAVKLLADNQIVGLGSGSSATFAIIEIGNLVKQGLKIQGVATSEKTAELARSLNIPLLDIREVDSIDITIDGADEFTTGLDLIKGGGSFLLKEKVVASLSKVEIIIADSSKHVEFLGKFTVPVEVIPYTSGYIIRQLAKLNGVGKVRLTDGSPLITEEGNYIVDADFGLIQDPAALSAALHELTGIVEHGLFVKMTNKVIMGHGDSTVIFS